MSPQEIALLGGVSGRLKRIVKQDVVGKRMNCAKTGGPILAIHRSHDVFLRKELPFCVSRLLHPR